ncbi:TonB-dependent receptor [Draconibacterium sp. IB214405]|uniref:TonB-dependent receptor n=1 Tax=Draconibacterium sp. IB214405 TaxID=3097352 RepID=UPI002A17B9F5|nr:TonB-dependent receptor [Draconibacterium sp. IB214405]MDX8338153.1 TonB-dependent receptor [Draconibacterium sp. IB214405]
MKKLSLFLFILFFVSAFAALAEDENENASNKGTIAGRIVDTDNLPLPGAAVVIEDLHKGAVTDVNGFYRIATLDPADYTVKVSYIGFKESVKQVSVTAGKTSTLNFQLEAGIDIEEVVVNGALQGQSKALNQQKSSMNITNIISSDQVGRFPDQNVGDALKRIPGINVQYDQGEARFGNIRGTSPEYNSVAVDGDRIPSAEAETRSIQLDLIPSDMIQSIEVNKVVTADMDADAIGGSVNLVTKSNPYSRRITGSVGGTYNALRGKVAPNFSLLYGDRFFNDKLGFTVAASVQDHMMGSDDLEAEWDDDGTMKEMQVRTYLIQRLRQSYSGALDYKFDANNKIEAKVMYNHRNDWENRYRVVYKDLDEDVAKIERQIKGGTNKDARLEDQRTYHFSLGGEHQIGGLEIDWKGSYSKANEDRPNERYLQYKFKDVEFSQNVTDPEKPQVIINTPDAQDFNSEWGFDELTEEHQYTEDIDKKFKVDFKYPFHNGTSVLRFGAKYKGKSKNRDNDFYEYEPTDEDSFNSGAFNNTIVKTKDDFLAGDYVAGTYVDVKYLGGLDLTSGDFEGEENLEELAGNFDASEDVTAGYIRFDQSFGSLDVVAGVRLENTSINYSGKELILDEEGDVEDLVDTEEVDNNYTNVLPSLLLKYEVGRNTNIKASVTNTLARPKYIDLVPRVEVNNEDVEIEIGNPDLTPTTSWNFDLMAEHYFQSIGLVSGGIFYKDISDFIVNGIQSDYSYLGQTWEKFTQPINAGDAKLFGVEMAFQRQFDFLPGFLRQTGFYANYTYTKSTVSNFQIEDREDDDLTLPGTPENTLNASLYYEGKKLSARLSYNYAGDFVEEYSDKAFEDVYYDQVSYLDFNTSYHFNKNFMIFAELNNILNTPLRYYQGESQYTYQAEYYDIKVNFGLKFNF